MALAQSEHMRDSSPAARHPHYPLPILCTGRCEVLKATIHGVVLGTAAVCALYNLAAWTVRRQRHLAINTGLYSALAVWEWIHVRHHVDCIPVPAAVEGKQVEDPAA
jgi:hypothetical protein